jgi:hypothetical protein
MSRKGWFVVAGLLYWWTYVDRMSVGRVPEFELCPAEQFIVSALVGRLTDENGGCHRQGLDGSETRAESPRSEMNLHPRQRQPEFAGARAGDASVDEVESP